VSRSNKQTYLYSLIQQYGTLKIDDALIALPSCNESIIFYYLDELVRLGLVQKTGDRYVLS
jgi:hypothetical protein